MSAHFVFLNFKIFGLQSQHEIHTISKQESIQNFILRNNWKIFSFSCRYNIVKKKTLTALVADCSKLFPVCKLN